MKKGFTLIELLIIMAIVGILAAIAIPQFQHYRTKKAMEEMGYTAQQVKECPTCKRPF